MPETSHPAKHFDYIDALRGYAILMVIAVHSSQYFNDLSPTVAALAAQGARGVQLFFVASAMTLTMSWASRHDGAMAFYVRRFFRIAPMFYLCIPIFLYFRGWGPSMFAPDGIGLRHVLMAVTFTHGFMPDTITSVVPGSWSIADEMMFYAIFPVLMAIYARASFSSAIALALLGTIACWGVGRLTTAHVAGGTDPEWRGVWGEFYSLWIINQLPCFYFGMLVARFTEERRRVFWPAVVVLGAIVFFIGISVFPDKVPFFGKLEIPMQPGLIFAALALGLSDWRPRILVNPVICWVGKVSYSAYLAHLLIIASQMPFPRENYPLAFVSLALMTVAISSATYLLVEKPFIRVGQALAEVRLDRKAAS